MLKADNLGKFYDTNDFLFRHFHLNITSGSVLAILGPNARGKTTLLKTLCGLLEPSEGRVERKGVVGYVPQTRETRVSYPVIEMVIMGRAATMRAWQNPGKREREIAYACLEQVHIAHLADMPYSHLSGGQKQLVLIARAIATEPATLLLDEPTSALDLRNQMLVLETCADLADKGLGIALTTHDPSHAALVADSVLALFPDQGYTLGTTADLLTSENLSRLYDTPVIVHEVEVAGVRQSIVTPRFSRSHSRGGDARPTS